MKVTISGEVVHFDAEDLGIIVSVNWRVEAQTGYVAGRYEGKTSLLHRVLMGEPEGLEVDHRDGNRRNCRKANLRVCSTQQNLKNKRRYKSNKSGFKGVYRDGKRWRAQVTHAGKQIAIGSYKTPEEAHAAYIREGTKLHGEFFRAE